MKKTEQKVSEGLTRRDVLMASALALGGLAVGGGAMSAFSAEKTQPINDCNPSGCPGGSCSYPPTPEAMQQYSYFNNLPKWKPTEGDPSNGIPETYIPPEYNEMRSRFWGRISPTNSGSHSR